MGKRFILNADDFGMTKEYNRAVLEGFNNGILTSASLCANGSAFSAAVNDILPECAGLGLGVHLNIIEGKSLTGCNLLTDKHGDFNKGYFFYILNTNNKNVLPQIEKELRAQIEKVKKYTNIDHIDSHVHTHAIPPIFELVCKLAEEYNIPCIRTQHEHFYTVSSFKKHIGLSYPLNLIKIVLLNLFTAKNKTVLKKFNLKTNNYIIGVGYTGMMDSDTVRAGLEALPETDCIAEALIHPCCYVDKVIKNSHTREFSITLDKKLKDDIYRLGFTLTNYKNLL